MFGLTSPLLSLLAWMLPSDYATLCIPGAWYLLCEIPHGAQGVSLAWAGSCTVNITSHCWEITDTDLQQHFNQSTNPFRILVMGIISSITVLVIELPPLMVQSEKPIRNRIALRKWIWSRNSCPWTNLNKMSFPFLLLPLPFRLCSSGEYSGSSQH